MVKTWERADAKLECRDRKRNVGDCWRLLWAVGVVLVRDQKVCVVEAMP